MNLDFDEEATKLYARINIDRSASRTTVFYSDTDAIYKHKKSGGTIYVGNKNAASNLSYLRSLGITKVVNCTHGESKIPDFHAGITPQAYYLPIESPSALQRQIVSIVHYLIQANHITRLL